MRGDTHIERFPGISLVQDNLTLLQFSQHYYSAKVEFCVNRDSQRTINLELAEFALNLW